MNSFLLGIGLPSGGEWFWVFLAVVVLFGAKKIPDLARGLGKSIGEFKRAKGEFEDELNKSIEESDTAKTESKKPVGAIEQNKQT
jgi:sec-independent protein translocase protein TatA